VDSIHARFLLCPRIRSPTQAKLQKTQARLWKPQAKLWKPQAKLWKPQVKLWKPQAKLWKPQAKLWTVQVERRYAQGASCNLLGKRRTSQSIGWADELLSLASALLLTNARGSRLRRQTVA